MTDDITARVAELREMLIDPDPLRTTLDWVADVFDHIPWALDTIERLHRQWQTHLEIEAGHPSACCGQCSRQIEEAQARAARLETMLRRNGKDQGCEFSEDLRVLHYWSTAWVHGEDVQALQASVQEQVRTLREALAWECEARDRAFALARGHEARLEEQSALLHALARRQAVHDITCPHRFCRDEDCECRLAPYTPREVTPDA